MNCHVHLWLFPESDFGAWCDLVGTPEVASYREYQSLLAAVQADLERNGQTVVRVPMTVDAMKAELAAHGWENSPGTRAAVLATFASQNTQLRPPA